jgi:hypothetical protein
MKLIRHGTQIVAIIQRAWEKAYLLSQRGKQEWIPVFLIDRAAPFAEIHSESRQVRLSAGSELISEQRVFFHDV